MQQKLSLSFYSHSPAWGSVSMKHELGALIKIIKNSNFNLLDWDDTNHHCNLSGIACSSRAIFHPFLEILPTFKFLTFNSTHSQEIFLPIHPLLKFHLWFHTGGAWKPDRRNPRGYQASDQSSNTWNSFQGHIPASVGKFTYIQTIELCGNRMSQSIRTKSVIITGPSV